MARPNPFLGNQARIAGTILSREVGAALGVSMTTAIINGTAQAARRVPAMARVIGATLERDIRQADRAKVNQGIAVEAVVAVHSAYQSRSPQRAHSDYRPGGGKKNRYAGVLGPLLSNTGLMTQGTSRDRIVFLNEEVLKDEAPHWLRLNYGAGSVGPTPQTYTGSLNGSVIFALQLENRRQPAVKLPIGFWVAPGGGRGGDRVPFGHGNNDEFYPSKRQFIAEVMIPATQFADAGVKTVAKLTLPRYSDMVLNAVKNPRTLAAIEAQYGRKINVAVDFRRHPISFSSETIPD